MKKTNLTRFLNRVRNTQVDEINCSTCLAQINAYVDLEQAAGSSGAAERMPRVKHHLDQCGICLDEYQILRELAQLDASDQLPTNQELADRLRGKAE